MDEPFPFDICVLVCYELARDGRGIPELLALRQVSSVWRLACDDPVLWHSIRVKWQWDDDSDDDEPAAKRTRTTPFALREMELVVLHMFNGSTTRTEAKRTFYLRDNEIAGLTMRRERIAVRDIFKVISPLSSDEWVKRLHTRRRLQAAYAESKKNNPELFRQAVASRMLEGHLGAMPWLAEEIAERRIAVEKAVGRLERRRMLVEAIGALGIQLHIDSELCVAFINGWPYPAGCQVPSLEAAVEDMQGLNYLHRFTIFPHLKYITFNQWQEVETSEGWFQRKDVDLRRMYDEIERAKTRALLALPEPPPVELPPRLQQRLQIFRTAEEARRQRTNDRSHICPACSTRPGALKCTAKLCMTCCRDEACQRHRDRKRK